MSWEAKGSAAIIVNHLISLNDDNVKRAFEDETKSVQGMMNYIMSKASKNAVNGVAMAKDDVVYGWAMHYCIESKEEIEKEIGKQNDAKPLIEKKEVKKVEKAKTEDIERVDPRIKQLSIFDF